MTSEAAVNAGFFNFAEHGVRSTTFDNLVAPPGGFAEYNESDINQIQGLGPSASADGVAFYTGTTFPATYQGDAFIARYNSTVSDSTGHSITYNDLVTVDPTTGNVRIVANNFDNPLAVLYDGSGNMIIADYGDSAIYRLSAAPTPTPTDAGFEQPSVGAGKFQYDPAGSSWAFSGSTGISANNSGFTSGNPPAPQGTQVAFLQGTGSFTQAVGFAAGSYVLTFDVAQRANKASHQDFQVLVDNALVGTFVPSGTSYQTITTSPFTVAAGTHTITFRGLDSAGGDNTVFIDSVAINMSGVPTASDAGFEQPSVGAGQFEYDPAGSPWAFFGSTGISANNSGFTAGNPPAPQGTQVAFLQETGSFSQTITGWSPGSYLITLSAAQRRIKRRDRTSKCWWTVSRPAPSLLPAHRTRAIPPPSSTWPGERTRSPSRAWIAPVATTQPSSTASPSCQPECGTQASSRCRWGPAATRTTRLVPPGPSLAVRGFRPITAASRPATLRRPRGRRWPSFRRPARSARQLALPPAPTRLLSTRHSAALSWCRGRTSTCWSTVSWSAPSRRLARRTRALPLLSSMSRPGYTRSSFRD